MANNLRIFKTEKETNTTNQKIRITRYYVCDGESHFVQSLFEILGDSGEVALSFWERRLQLGECAKTCYLDLGFLPAKAEMKFLSINLIDPVFNKKS